MGFSLFYLQPSSIPSDDPDWTAVQAVSHGGLGIMDKINENFTGQDDLKFWKDFAEQNPFSGNNINTIRSWFDLSEINQWEWMKFHNGDVVIPMMPGTFKKPSDWWDNVHLTDFIFLRSGGGGASQLEDDITQFIQKARDDGAKVGLMTFSSMPVPRAKMLKCATDMVSKTKFDLRLIYVGQRFDDCHRKMS